MSMLYHVTNIAKKHTYIKTNNKNSQYFLHGKKLNVQLNYGNTVYWNYHHNSTFHKHDTILHHILISNLFIYWGYGIAATNVVVVAVFVAVVVIIVIIAVLVFFLFLIIIFSLKRRTVAVISNQEREIFEKNRVEPSLSLPHFKYALNKWLLPSYEQWTMNMISIHNLMSILRFHLKIIIFFNTHYFRNNFSAFIFNRLFL